MTERFLLVGSDGDWLEGLQIALEDARVEAASVRTEAATGVMPPLAVAGGTFTAAVLAAFPGPGIDAGAAAERALHASGRIRGTWPSIPLLFVDPNVSCLIADRVREVQPAEALVTEDVGALCGALARMRIARTGLGARAATQASYATVEVEIGVERIKTVIAIDGVVEDPPSTTRWTGLERLHNIDEIFARWKPIIRSTDEGWRFADDWPTLIRHTGEDIYRSLVLQNGANASAISRCIERVGHIKHVHFRFSLCDDQMRHVPFELIWDPDKKYYLREVAPVARRVMLNDRARIGMPPKQPLRAMLTGPVLFVKSYAHGTLSVRGLKFGDDAFPYLKKLEYLDKELEGIKTARESAGLDEPEVLNLEPGQDAYTRIREKLGAKKWDIVHFAGHSIRSDDGQVHLVIPGDKKGPSLMRVAAFGSCASEQKVRLAILSSCESSSADTVFRLAQAGLPSAIGFRWEVDDEEAAIFTTTLHRELARSQPLGRAFHTAVQHVREHITEDASESPTFASAILAAQEDEWAAVLA